MQRKVFRIEQLAARGRPTRATLRDSHANDPQTVARELAALKETVAGQAQELAALLSEGRQRRMARAAGELGAAVEVMEKSTDKILKSAEIIDECAKTLGAAQKNDSERALADDIEDHVTRIYEACNFQDLAGQRIGKVIETLNQVEETITRVLARCQERSGNAVMPAKFAGAGGLINGPRLDGDGGHASQSEIDALFN